MARQPKNDTVAIAQLAARRSHNPKVVSSMPHFRIAHRSQRRVSLDEMDLNSCGGQRHFAQCGRLSAAFPREHISQHECKLTPDPVV